MFNSEHIVPADASPKTIRRIKNNYYCKVSRRKKKEYVTELESKIEDLEAQVAQLNQKISMLQCKISSFAIGDEKDFKELHDIQNYSREIALRELENEKDIDKLKK